MGHARAGPGQGVQFFVVEEDAVGVPDVLADEAGVLHEFQGTAAELADAEFVLV